MIATRGASCARAREWASLELDGELSDFEHALLVAHLSRCGECRAFDADLAALAGRIRTTPLEWPERELTLPRRRHAGLRGLQAAAAAAAVVVAAVGLASLLSAARSDVEQARSALTASVPSDDALIRQARLPALKSKVPVSAVAQRGLGLAFNNRF